MTIKENESLNISDNFIINVNKIDALLIFKQPGTYYEHYYICIVCYGRYILNIIDKKEVENFEKIMNGRENFLKNSINNDMLENIYLRGDLIKIQSNFIKNDHLIYAGHGNIGITSKGTLVKLTDIIK